MCSMLFVAGDTDAVTGVRDKTIATLSFGTMRGAFHNCQYFYNKSTNRILYTDPSPNFFLQI